MRRTVLWWLAALSAAAYLLVVVGSALASGEDGWREWLWLLLGPPSFLAAGMLLFVKRPGHPVGELLLLTAIAGVVIPQVLATPVVMVYEESGAQDWMWAPIWAHQTLSVTGAVLVVTIVTLLPDGRFRYPRERRFLAFAWATVAIPTLALVSNRFVVQIEALTFPGMTDIPSPLIFEALEPYGSALAGLSSLGYFALVGGVVLLVMRMRTAPRRERKQVRWVLFAGILALLVWAVPLLFAVIGPVDPFAHGGVGVLVGFFMMLLVPASIVAAVLQPPWIDVDVAIRKSFVYGALSFLILVVYVGLASAFGLAAETRLPVEVAVVATVVVAVLFQPVRRRLQSLADRWVFGERPTEFEVVTDFASALGSSADPSDLIPKLAETLTSALGLAWARVEVPGQQTRVSGKPEGEAALVAPIVHQGEHLGEIVCGPPEEGNLGESKAQLIATLADQAALALYNARLASRVVAAQEAERRRIERNIHDGAQQELVALVARLGMARARARSSALDEATVADLQREAQRILADLREMAQGIHPSVLSDGGLLEAVEDLCGRLPIEVTLDAPSDLRMHRFPDEVEGGAFFFMTEGIANVLKHSRAQEAAIALRLDDGHLTIEVSDQGVGFDPEARSGNGLAGLTDRITALGGSMQIDSEPGKGTSLHAVLPVEGRAP
jgi:signal transduction histidine kinase